MDIMTTKTLHEPHTAQERNPEQRKQARHDEHHLRLLMHHLHDSPLELGEDQREIAHIMVRQLVRDIADGRHPIMAELLNNPERQEETAENLVSPISRLVKGMSIHSNMISDAMAHHLNESDHYQQSAVETPAEEMLRKLSYKDSSLANYLQLEEIEKKEAKGELPKESATAFMQRLKESQASIRVPGQHERRLIGEWFEKAKQAVHNVTHHHK